MPTLVVFDVDGTLCDTCDADQECFLRAVGEALHQDLGGVDWAAAPHVTDSGVLDWFWRLYRHCSPTPEEAKAVVDRFVDLLTELHRRAPGRFRPVAGAPSTVAALGGRGLGVAVATGGWKRAARFKLRAARIPPKLLLASSDDSEDRVAVFRMAAERAGAAGADAADIVLVGDGVWDVDVARRLRWRFVGIGTDEKARRLRDAGAGTVLADLRGRGAVEKAVAESRVPGAPG